jgi:serine protease
MRPSPAPSSARSSALSPAPSSSRRPAGPPRTAGRQRRGAPAAWSRIALACLLATSPGLVLSPTALAAPATPSPSAALPAESAVARVIVQYRADATLPLASPGLAGAEIVARQAQRASRLSARSGVALRAGRSISERQQVVFATGISSEALAARLAAQPDVEFAVPDRRMKIRAVPNDPRYDSVPVLQGGPAAGQWYLKPPSSTIFSAIDAQTAWDVPGVGGNAVVVAVLDTGIRFDHPDLPTLTSGSMLPGRDMIGADDVGRLADGSLSGAGTNFGTAGDGNGRDADPSDEGDFLTSGEIAANPTAFQGCSTEDFSSWHGTQVSGLIAAIANNGRGMAGMGRNVRLLPVRVLGKCGGYTSDIAAGIRWAAGISVPGEPVNGTPAKVINLSLGGDPGACDAPLDSAVTAAIGAGAVVVAAGGNVGIAPTAPANCPGAIGVAGVRHTGTKVGYSALGPEIAIAAPAGNCVNDPDTDPCLYPILSASNAGTTAPITASEAYTNGINEAIGTSFASPLVAGAAALMLSVNPTLSPARVREIIQQSARAFPTTGAGVGVGICQPPSSTEQRTECYCTTSTCGAGMLDAYAAVRAAAVGAPPAPPPPPPAPPPPVPPPPAPPPPAGGPPPAPPPSGGGGGGGGAVGGAWLAALFAAAAALRRSSRRTEPSDRDEPGHHAEPPNTGPR